MIKPAYLKEGDRVCIVAPCGKVSHPDVMYGKSILQLWGLEVEMGEYLFEDFHNFSAPDKMRLADFQKALDDHKIKAIFCARGGYGSLRIIDQLDFTKFNQNPKWICGFSDITVFHGQIQQMGIESIHSIMPVLFKNYNLQHPPIQSLKRAVFGDDFEYTFTVTKQDKKGIAKGELVGGNLTLLNNLMGSKGDVDTNGKILFIEDVGEYLYHVERMLICFKRSGKLTHLKGLIVGGFTNMKDNEEPFGKTIEQMVLDLVDEYNYPVCFNFPAGHQSLNCAFYLGRETTLEVGSETVTIQQLK